LTGYAVHIDMVPRRFGERPQTAIADKLIAAAARFMAKRAR